MCDNLLNVFPLKLHCNDVRTNKQLELEKEHKKLCPYFIKKLIAILLP